MLVQDHQKAKVFGIRAIMNNRKLYNIVKEAMESSPGSTKRQKAAAVFKSLNKLGQNKYGSDGMGGGPSGPFTPMYPMTMDPRIAGPSPATNVSVAPAQPTGQVNVVDTPQTGQITGVVDKPQTGAGQVSVQDQPGTIMFPAAPSPQKTMEDQMKDVYAREGVEGVGRFLSSIGEQKPTGTAQPSPDTGLIYPTDTAQLPPTPPKPGEEREDYYDAWYGGLSEDQKSRWKPLYEALSSGVGAETFAYQMMADRDKLKELLPGVPEDALPEGASLARQVDDLSETLKDEYQVDELRNNLRRLQETGVTIEKDLGGYLTAKDQYISKLDSMINTAKASMANMDMANPFVQKKMNKYLDYLYVMKGRQQKRYADFLGDAIQQYNAKLTRAENAYNDAVGDFQKELSTKKEITTEDYNRFSTMLKDMYNNLDSREEDELKLGKLREDYLQAVYDTAEAANDANNPDFEEVTPDARMDMTRQLRLLVDPESGKIKDEKTYREKEIEWDNKYGGGSFKREFPTGTWLEKAPPISDLSKWELEAMIWKWLETNEAKNMSDDQISSEIRQAGLNPESFGYF